jgi:ATP-binding cassette subfamily C exporter for protease/lipase
VGSWRQFIGMRAAFTRLEKLLVDFPPRDPAFKRVPPEGDIALTQVFANAPGRELPILQNISLNVPAGTVTAVLGPSGSGKSTLARVLMGIWPDVVGDVTLNGLPISGWNRLELGPYLGYLPQDVELLEGSIAENIARFGEVDPDLVIEAAQSAGLHEMILRFPKGYDTSIGEAGNLLSGGQRQRIGLARAVYGNPVLIVLDEPNANLDDAGEAALYKTVQLLKAKGTTVFLITHRPGAVAVADRILMLRGGQVQADGPRAEVLAALQAARQPPAQPASGLSVVPA